MSLPTLALRLLLALGGGVAALVFWGEATMAALLPLFRGAIETLAPDFTVQGLTLTFQGSDRVLRLDIANRYHLFLGGQRIPPGASTNSTINALAPLIPAVVGLATVAAWPGRGREVAWRLPVLLLFLPLVMLLDTPLVLVALTWDFWHYNFNPGEWSPWSAWMQFLTRGGRGLLGLVAGMGAVGVVAWAGRGKARER